MAKRCIYTDADGLVHQLMPAYSDRTRPAGMTDDKFYEYIVAKDLPAGISTYYTIDDSAAPSDRTFRDAWEISSEEIVVNMTKARAIHLEQIRRVRNAELVKEDITFMRAVEAGDTDTQATIATKKQVLRDIPATFDITTGVDTPEKLKAKWPTELPDRE